MTVIGLVVLGTIVIAQARGTAMDLLVRLFLRLGALLEPAPVLKPIPVPARNRPPRLPR